MSKFIGIDLGTSNSCVSVVENGKPVVIVNAEGKSTTPSIVGFLESGERKIGDAAKRQAITNPKNTVYEIKRFMGQEFKNVKDIAEAMTYDVVDVNGQPRVKVNEREYTPQEISAIILQKMKKTAEDYLGTEVKDAVITVPAYFNDDQRKATKEAGEIAGLTVHRIINEPTAAALAYGLNDKPNDEKVLIFDFGGGTHDVSLIEISGKSDGNDTKVFEVIGTDGNTRLGGSKIDEILMKYIVDNFKNENGVDISLDPMAMQRVKEAAEKAKIELSSSTSTEINLPYLFPVDNVPKHYVETLSRAKFEQMIAPIVAQTMEPVKHLLETTGVAANEVDEIILVGGSTRIPAVQKAVEDYFGKPASHSLNPDEAVAQGAARQGDLLAGNSKSDILLLDVTPLNLGVETMGGVVTTMVEANTTIPCVKKETFSTAADNQTAITVNLIQGNGKMVNSAGNKSLGMFNLDGIAPARRGIPQIEISVNINADGIIEVSARDKATDKEQHITISGNSGLSKEEIERMKSEAEANADADKKAYEDAMKINNLETMSYGIESSLDEDNIKNAFTDEQKTQIKDKIAEMKKALAEKDVNRAESIQKEISEIYDPIVKQLYEAQAAQQTANESASASSTASDAKTDESKAEDVPFEEVKD